MYFFFFVRVCVRVHPFPPAVTWRHLPLADDAARPFSEQSEAALEKQHALVSAAFRTMPAKSRCLPVRGMAHLKNAIFAAGLRITAMRLYGQHEQGRLKRGDHVTKHSAHTRAAPQLVRQRREGDTGVTESYWAHRPSSFLHRSLLLLLAGLTLSVVQSRRRRTEMQDKGRQRCNC